jgi:CheY-like chemotaxis protein
MTRSLALLVENHPQFRYVYTSLLRDLVGCEVHAVVTPEEARRFLEEGNDVQVVVTHIHFPDEKQDRDYRRAAELCRFIRNSISDTLPIIGLQSTEVSDQFLAEAGFPENMIACIIGFHRPEDFVNQVKDALHGTPV